MVLTLSRGRVFGLLLLVAGICGPVVFGWIIHINSIVIEQFAAIAIAIAMTIVLMFISWTGWGLVTANSGG